MPNPRSASSPMIISPPASRQADPTHTPVEHIPGFNPMPGRRPPASMGQQSGGGRRYPSTPSPGSSNVDFSAPPVNPFEERRVRGDDVDRLGYEAYDLQPSPTHAYLEAFDSTPSTPEPVYSPRGLGTPQNQYNQAYAGIGLGSPSSPGLDATEKDPLDAHPGGFGGNQYSSNHFLAPSSYPSRLAGAPGPSPAGTRNISSTSKKNYNKRGCLPTNPTKRRWVVYGIPIILIIIAAGAAVGVYFGLVKKPTTSGSAGSGAGTGTATNTTITLGSTPTPVAYNATLHGVAGSGKNGSIVTTDLGAQFTYVNSQGGEWAQNPLNPYSVSGRAQSWSPSMLETWVWGQHIVRGVNLGGWLVTEPFIVTGLYEQYQNTKPQAVDEYTLCQAMGANLAVKMEEHYRTFITEQDFADIAKYGLNWVRIPIGYWAIETRSDEPFLPRVSWQYFLKAIAWGRKYGIRILLDFHALPGSQNGWNHSGKAGSVNWMRGTMGIANAQRHLEQIRSLTEFLSQDGIKQVVPAISLVNEVQSIIVGANPLRSFYYQAYNMIRGITGYGVNNGPIIVIHEGFDGIAAFDGFMAGADRLAIDQHPYLAFGEQNLASHATQARIPCTWGGGTNDSQTAFGITLGGEWSNAINNCGKWLNGVGAGNSYDKIPGSLGCTHWEEWFKWDQATKDGILQYNMATMDALQNWFFWTWRIGNSTQMGYPTSPQWHYKLGVENGWIPTDPRVAGGFCRGIGVGGNQFAGTFPASATGAVASSVAPANTSAIAFWPPTSIGASGGNFTLPAQLSLLPTYTQTGPRITMATALHPANVTIGSGWAAATDTAGAWVPVAGCNYPNAYDATNYGLLPTARCTGGAAPAKTKRDLGVQVTAMPQPTPAPI